MEQTAFENSRKQLRRCSTPGECKANKRCIGVDGETGDILPTPATPLAWPSKAHSGENSQLSASPSKGKRKMNCAVSGLAFWRLAQRTGCEYIHRYVQPSPQADLEHFHHLNKTKPPASTVPFPSFFFF